MTYLGNLPLDLQVKLCSFIFILAVGQDKLNIPQVCQEG